MFNVGDKVRLTQEAIEKIKGCEGGFNFTKGMEKFIGKTVTVYSTKHPRYRCETITLVEDDAPFERKYLFEPEWFELVEKRE